jgi:hypothetical protein
LPTWSSSWIVEELIEQNVPDEFFNNPQSVRTKLILSKALNH